MAKMIKTTFRLKRGDASVWTAKNPVLDPGEPGFEIDTGKLKIGNGIDAWNDLAYLVGEGGGGQGSGATNGIEFVDVHFSLIGDNEFEINSVNKTFEEINNAVEEGKYIIAKLIMENSPPSYLPMIQQNSIIAIFSGILSSQSIYFQIQKENDEEQYSIAVNELNSSSSSSSYEAGNGIKIENNAISTIYGDEIIETKEIGDFNSAYLTDNTSMIDINDLSENSIPFVMIQMTYSFYDLKENENLILTVEDKDISTYEATGISDNAEGIPYICAGDSDFMDLLLSGEIPSELLDRVNNGYNNYCYVYLPSEGFCFFVFTKNLYNSIINYGSHFFTNEILGKTIPDTSIRGGPGIKINSNATISLDYGVTDKKIPAFYRYIDQMQIASSSDSTSGLYGYYAAYGELKQYTGEQAYSTCKQSIKDYFNNAIIKNSEEKNNSFPIGSLEGEFSTINDDRNRISFDFYYGSRDEYETLIAYAINFADLSLYAQSFLQGYLREPTYVSQKYSFFVGLYNTQETTQEFIQNLTLTQNNPNKNCFGNIFIFDKEGYFSTLWFTPSQDTFINDTNKQILLGNEYDIRKPIKEDMLIPEYNISLYNTNSLILGNDNALVSTDNSLILGKNNQLSQASNELICGSRNIIVGRGKDFSGGRLTVGQGNIVYDTVSVNSIIGGSYNKILAGNSLVCGSMNIAGGGYNIICGTYNQNSNQNSLVIGQYNDNKNNTVLEIGGGNSENSRKNIFEVNTSGMAKVTGLDGNLHNVWHDGMKMGNLSDFDSNEISVYDVAAKLSTLIASLKNAGLMDQS